MALRCGVVVCGSCSCSSVVRGGFVYVGGVLYIGGRGVCGVAFVRSSVRAWWRGVGAFVPPSVAFVRCVVWGGGGGHPFHVFRRVMPPPVCDIVKRYGGTARRAISCGNHMGDIEQFFCLRRGIRTSPTFLCGTLIV